MRYTIKTYAGNVLTATYSRTRRDFAARRFELTVYNQVKALAGLDTIWGKRAVAEAQDVYIRYVDLVTVPVGPDHRVTYQRTKVR